MGKATKEQRQASINKAQMNETWVSFQHLLEEDLDRLDWRMYKMNQEARGFGVQQDYITKFVTENMEILIKRIVDKREYDTRQGARGRKKA